MIRTVVIPILVGGDKLRLVSRSRWRDSVETLADLACAVTRHRFCHRIYGPVWVWAEKTERVVFETVVTNKDARAIFPDAYLEDDDE